VLELLSSHRVAEAAEAADRAGLPRLAGLVLQAGGDYESSSLMQQQLQLWTYMGADDLVPVEVLKVYRFLGAAFAASPSSPSPSPRPVLRGLGWRRAVGALFWYGCFPGPRGDDGHSAGATLVASGGASGSLTLALHNYKVLLADKDGSGHAAVDPPTSREGTVEGTKDGLFALLDTLLGGGSVVEALRPEGLVSPPSSAAAPDGALDYRPAFLVLSLLETLPGPWAAQQQQQGAGGKAGQGLAAQPCAALVRQHVCAQLAQEGSWAWAVSIALRTPAAPARSKMVRDLLFRWAGSRVGSDWDPQGDEDAAFFVQRLRIPAAWVFEAAAARSAALFQQERHAHFLAKAAQSGAQGAASTLLARASAAVDSVAARAHVEMKGWPLELMHTLPSSEAQTSVFLDFLRLREDADRVARDASAGLAPAREQRVVLARLSSQALALLAKAEAQYQRLSLPSACPLLEGSGDKALTLAALCDIATTLSRNLETWASAAAPGLGALDEDEDEDEDEGEGEEEDGQRAGALARALGAFESAGVDGRRRRERRIAAQ